MRRISLRLHNKERLRNENINNQKSTFMITFKRCKEIFANKEVFCDFEKGSGTKYYRVNMINLSQSGEHYDFGYRRMPNGYNDVAEVFFGKWTPLKSYVVCHNICDEDFLLELIKQCHEVGNF